MKPTNKPAPIPFMIPCVVNVRDVAPDQVEELIDSMVNKLGAKFFRDKDLFMAVHDDHIDAALEPHSFMYGPYIKLIRVPSGDLRITTCDGMGGGETCYAISQFKELVDSGLASKQLKYESQLSQAQSPSR